MEENNNVLLRIEWNPDWVELNPEYKDAEAYHFWCEGCDCIHEIRKSGPGANWTFNDNLVRPTFHPSYLCGSPKYKEGKPIKGTEFSQRRCHSFIKDGIIQYLNDCHHDLAGKTVPLIPVHTWRYGNDF